jgi:hypothetical protein
MVKMVHEKEVSKSSTSAQQEVMHNDEADTPLSSLLDPLEGLSVLNCGKLELEGRTWLPALKGVGGAC